MGFWRFGPRRLGRHPGQPEFTDHLCPHYFSRNGAATAGPDGFAVASFAQRQPSQPLLSSSGGRHLRIEWIHQQYPLGGTAHSFCAEMGGSAQKTHSAAPDAHGVRRYGRRYVDRIWHLHQFGLERFTGRVSRTARRVHARYVTDRAVLGPWFSRRDSYRSFAGVVCAPIASRPHERFDLRKLRDPLLHRGNPAAGQCSSRWKNRGPGRFSQPARTLPRRNNAERSNHCARGSRRSVGGG